MACLSHSVSFCITYRTDQKPKKQSFVKCVNVINGTKLLSQEQAESLQIRQNIPTKKQFVDPYRQGIITEEEALYRQTVVVRSYEVGPDKTATIESILNLLQETALNHVWMSGLLGDGFGATHGMMRNNLIWVVSRMQVQVDHYPIWGEVMEIDTWVGASGKNGMRRDWLLRSKATGVVFARGTSTWVMMNRQTRRLSKMPDEVRAEISPWFIAKQAIEEDSPEKIDKVGENAQYERSNLKPKRSDLDMNNHVNNVKYVRWMFETIPDEFLESHQLSEIILEYRRECGSSDVVQSLSEPQESGLIKPGIQQCNSTNVNGHSSLSHTGILEGNGLLGLVNQLPRSYIHLLQLKGETKNEEMVRGKTTWKRKHIYQPFSVPP
ncbi:palmitoyl-acyl carrier protein thioesterase, chloroplastic-like [Andrographis paniculata]|uniref:palmitoyl-acyl carrier protein thioesterase, chloroplastic-like n=1 Tax=Andrographis paniculata TaxID=175694 RepID=UPI0021E8AAD9|nr:palmitoyl-acyl carrier protein thioesterase, chloroplastic-like [Andrographis paniculata]